MKPKRSLPFGFLFSVTAAAAFVLSTFLSGHVVKYVLIWAKKPYSRLSVLAFWVLAFILFISLLTFFTNIFLLRPVKRLSDGTKEIIKGNFRFRIWDSDSIYIREIRTIIDHFNIMAKELESTEIVHNDFARNVSHEFKTPLSVIKGYGNLLQKEELCREERLLYAKKIVENTDRLTALTSQILLLSRLENQQTQLLRQNFNLAEQIRQAVLLYENVWTEKGIDIALDIPQLLLFTGNEELLFQVWQNLIDNALKFTKSGGFISIRCDRHFRKTPEACPCTAVLFQDTGIGISPEELSHIFDKFYQSEKSRCGAGCGLGLPMVKKILELHGGTIFAESFPGEGSTFTVCLSQGNHP